ncbi:MAG: TetR/AcrR family transcriptional regulator [Coriobacteriales bacterium]|jgi:AcrR family transcriptional regulator
MVSQARHAYKVSENRRRSIIHVARKHILNEGFSKVSMKKIAEEANISRGSIYYYFENKNALIRAVMEEYLNEILAAFDAWNNYRKTEKDRESLRRLIILFKKVAALNVQLRNEVDSKSRNQDYAKYIQLALDKISDKLCAFAKLHLTHYSSDEDVKNQVYIIAAGLMTYLCDNPDAEVNELVDITARMFSATE